MSQEPPQEVSERSGEKQKSYATSVAEIRCVGVAGRDFYPFHLRTNLCFPHLQQCPLQQSTMSTTQDTSCSANILLPIALPHNECVYVSTAYYNKQ